MSWSPRRPAFSASATISNAARGNFPAAQQQRVAIGRAIVREPDVFLFDEPLSNLDAKLRVEMRTEIKRLHRRLQNTVVYVTHDQVEAMTLADRVVVMNQGRIEQVASPIELYEHPANTFVASVHRRTCDELSAGRSRFPGREARPAARRRHRVALR